ncbi:hypothetical protein WJ63_08170 [Burkholderia pyrrocinia]|nr:hypothetical protein WJ63_08170 [Burkholderia pyrrocinia]
MSDTSRVVTLTDEQILKIGYKHFKPGHNVKAEANFVAAVRDVLAAHPSQQEPRAEVTDWQPIATAPADQLVTVFWLDSEDEKNPERYDFDYIEEGGWVKWNDHYDWAHSVAPAGSRMPREQAPYTHWKPLGSPTRAINAPHAGDSHAA